MTKHFHELFEKEDPAYEIFLIAHATVFDRGDDITEHIDRLSRESRLVYLLWCFDGEVHNGGFNQFFTNSLGDYSQEILVYLKEIGAVESYELLEKAMSWFPDSAPSTDQELRWKQYEQFCEDANYDPSLDALNQRFYEYKDNLASLLNAYVRANSNAAIRV